jgi:hypothetical protein
MDSSKNLTTCPVCATCAVCPTCATCAVCPTPSTPSTCASCPTCNSRPFFELENTEPSPIRTIYSIFHSIITLFAIYLSFKCNDGFDFLGFITAIFFPHIYIIYKYATSETFCNIKKSIV